MSLCEADTGLFGTCVSLETVERGLRRGLRTTHKCGSQRHIDMIGENQGFFSRVGLLHCNWPDDSHLPSEVVIKITTLLNTIAMHQRNGSKKKLFGEAAKKEKISWMLKATKLRKWHNNEVLFYNAARLMNIQFVPRLYHATTFDEENTENGYICMQFAQGTVCSQIYEYLTVEQIKEVLRAMAELQGNMWKMNDEKKKDFTVSAYDELFGDILKNDVLSFRLEELREYSTNLSDLIDQILPHIGKVANVRVAKRDHSDLGMTPLFVHGDLYTPNLLWKLNENGKPELDKIIDWQLCHFGSPAEDICRLVISSMRPNERHESIDEILLDYYLHLTSLIDTPLFDFMQLKTSYEHFFGVAGLAFVGTIVEVSGAAMSNFPKDEIGPRKEIIVDKVEAVLSDVLKNITF